MLSEIAEKAATDSVTTRIAARRGHETTTAPFRLSLFDCPMFRILCSKTAHR
jgi:hypothetical protein